MILRPLTRGLVAPVIRGITAPRIRGDALTPAVQALFASGEKGVMLDFSRASNLYTDSARTTLVTASGDAIGSATDLSGNGKHASSSSTMRPLWNSAGYATWDAFDDYMQTAAIDFSGTDAVTIIAGVRKSSDAAAGVVCELGASSANNGTFALYAPASAASNVGFLSRGTASSLTTGTPFAAPTTLVATGEGDISTDLANLRVNGAQSASAAGDQGTGNYQNVALNIGARNGGASVFLNGRIYRLLIIGRALTATERGNAERWAAQPAGVALA